MADAPGGGGAAPPGELRRQLGFFDVAALHVGAILGSGIFVAPAAIAAASAGPASAAVLWLAGGLVAACGASIYAECGSRLPHAGGFYVYYREVYGPAMAFVGGWAALLVTYPASAAAIALVFGHYIGQVVPPLQGHATACAAAAVVATGVINALGVRLAAIVQRILSGSKIAALAALALAALVAGGALAGRAAGSGMAAGVAAGGTAGVAAAPAVAATAAGALGALSWSAILGAVVVMLWTYDGWSDIGFIAGEVRDPGRVLGRAVLVSSVALAAVYALVQAAVMFLLPPARAAGSERVVAEAVEAGLGRGAGVLVAALVALCTFGSVHSVVLGVTRLGYAMGRDGAFLRFFARIDPRLGTPARSTAAIVTTTLVYVFVARFRDLLGLFTFSVWIFYAITAIALLVLRRRGTGEATAWRAPGGLLAPILVLGTAAAMTAGLMADNPGRSFLGLGLLASGFAAYALWRRVVPADAAGPAATGPAAAGGAGAGDRGVVAP
ncbi:MAG TPA: amino acid permease [Patescibacteria group bacterium]|nr:amino acid permease [Patescibacteria group bacterium]